MNEVLEKMYEDSSVAISKDERELFIIQIKQGQIYDFKKEHERALTLWGSVLNEVQQRVSSKRAEILELKKSTDSDASSTSASDDENNGIQDELLVKKRHYLQTKRGNELRDLQDLQHRLTFMMASANFQLKNEGAETRLYEEAEKLRREVISFSVPLN